MIPTSSPSYLFRGSRQVYACRPSIFFCKIVNIIAESSEVIKMKTRRHHIDTFGGILVIVGVILLSGLNLDYIHWLRSLLILLAIIVVGAILFCLGNMSDVQYIRIKARLYVKLIGILAWTPGKLGRACRRMCSIYRSPQSLYEYVYFVLLTEV